MEENIRGYVVVGFDVEVSGETSNVHVVDAHPPSVFDQAALDAVKKTLYYPLMVDGVAVKAVGRRVKLNFDFEE